MERESWLSFFLTRTQALGRAVFGDPANRCRTAIVVAAFLVCGYALSVLAYVVAVPEIGVRCAFTPVVNHFYKEFLYPQEGQQPLLEGDLITEVGGEPVSSWSHLLRKVLVLRDEEPDPFTG